MPIHLLFWPVNIMLYRAGDVSFCLYLAETQDNTRYVCLLEDTSDQSCPMGLKPMADHIALQELSFEKLKETKSKLNRLEEKQTTVKHTLFTLEMSMESWKKDFQSRLERLESGQKLIEHNIEVILDKLKLISCKIIYPKLKQIAFRYFYIENSLKLDWLSAETTCCKMGGHLANYRNREESDGVSARLKLDEAYWLGSKKNYN